MKVWLIGAYGIVSTTAMVGAKALEKDLIDKTGLVSELKPFKNISEYVPLKFEFGGHDIRPLPTAYDATLEHWEMNRHFDRCLLDEVGDELRRVRA
ncbi:MAG: myo-inositol-1-phosphate synthase, partial [Archaeoglobales archaeon]